MRRLYVSIGSILLATLGLVGCQATPEQSSGPRLFFPSPPAPPRIQFLTWASGSPELQPPKSAFEKFVIGDDAEDLRRIDKPYGVAARDGVVYVCDTKGLSLVRLDFAKHAYSVLGERGPGRLQKPLNVAIDALGYKFVADAYRRQIVVFGPDDEYATAFSIPEPCHPVDLALHENEIYVLDNERESPRVVVLDRSNGTVLRSFGELGSEDAQFKVPNSLSVDEEGFVYVSDTLNYRIQKLTPQGELVWERGVPGYRLGEFGRPRGIRVAPDGIVYVVDGATEIVQMYDPDGQILMRFGGPGVAPGALTLPSTLCIDTTSIPHFEKYVHPDFDVDYLIFVVSQYGPHLVNVYAFGSFPEGYELAKIEAVELPEVPKEGGLGAVEELDETDEPDGETEAEAPRSIERLDEESEAEPDTSANAPESDSGKGG